jgi:hypothetical protein
MSAAKGSTSVTPDSGERESVEEMPTEPGREEQEVFDALAGLCAAPGYIHALAYLYQSNNWITYKDAVTPEDMLPNYSHERLIRTELSTLFGLLVRSEIDVSFPGAHVVQSYIDRSNTLLSELHETLTRPMRDEMLAIAQVTPVSGPAGMGAFLREAIFYGAESAYVFQYQDLARIKYQADEAWLLETKGFSIAAACDVVNAIFNIQPDRILSNGQDIVNKRELWSALPAFNFTVAEITELSRLSTKTVEAVLTAFSMDAQERNEPFTSLKAFNVVNAKPLLRVSDGSFFSFHPASIAEALYESPFYWMLKHKTYKAAASKHRGEFTEEYCHSRLVKIFGDRRVHSNIELIDSHGNASGEVDVLVVFGDRALVLQAKSKRLTLEARKGNDLQLQEDFKLAVQDAYDQGATCSHLIMAGSHTLIERTTQQPINLGHLKEIYVFCVLADHYPSLSFQAHQFLKLDTNAKILPPFVTDVFALDVITEMLESPLRFLSYVNRRVSYHDRVMSSHETNLLAYHLRLNLWVSNELNCVMISDDVAVDLDIAMAARRTGIPGARTPKGILTRLQSTVVAQILSEIEDKEEPAVIEFGFMLLTLGEDTVMQADHYIRRINKWTCRDGKPHDFTMSLSGASSGFTFHCNNSPFQTAQRALHVHCVRRKYAERAASWFGVCLHPGDLEIRTGVTLQHEWKQDATLDEMTKDMAPVIGTSNAQSRSRAKSKTGRNEPCPCRSGKKYKKCCLVGSGT